jgi:transposase
MRKLEIATLENLQALLREELTRSPHSRFTHRLHCVRLVGAGHSCYEVARAFGDSPRSVERWVSDFERNGIEGLKEKPHPGRHALLSEAQMAELADEILRAMRTPGVPGGDWNSARLRDEIRSRFDLLLSARHCRRLLNILRETGQRVDCHP